MKFVAKGLEDIATHFDQRANRLAERSKSETLTIREKVRLAGEADGWTAAADILRDTQLVPPTEVTGP